MPKFIDHPSDSRVKAIIVADSGVGKTASLASLANAGYRLRILDFDNGLDILRNYVEPDAMDNIHYRTFNTEDPKSPDEAARMAVHWKSTSNFECEDLGPISETGSKDVLVLATASSFGHCVEEFEMKKHKDGRKGNWEAQKTVARFLQYLAGPNVPCNVIVNTHYRLVENEQTGQMKAYPEVVGRVLAMKVGRHFNNLWRIDIKRVEKQQVRMLKTGSDAYMALKCSAPNAVKTEEPLDLADIFNRMTSKKGN